MSIGNKGFKLKSESEFKIMSEGGLILAKVKNQLAEKAAVGVSAYDIDQLAEQLILAAGAKPSFKMVKGYKWTTCINVNDGVVHGIPKKSLIFKSGDLVSIDVGVYYKGFHTDTSVSVGLNVDKNKKKFLQVGLNALNNAIEKARPGARIYDISEAMELELTKNKLSPIKVLVGHGIGRDLHEDPQIPCFRAQRRLDSLEIPVGAAIAIEVMYSEGNGEVSLENDGWTISSSDGTITGLFEDTVFVTENGPKILTRES
jgi:methionyl aminopeptidase